jgi:hypothetical protein
MQAKWDEVREAFAQLGLALDFSEYDKAVKNEEPEFVPMSMNGVLFNNIPDDSDAPF